MLEGPFGRMVHALRVPARQPGRDGARRRAPAVRGLGARRADRPLDGLLDIEKAYFTSRGIGIIDVNYGGSTGYGRAYRERLRRQWGVVDVEDAIAAARALAGPGRPTGARLGDPGRLGRRLDGAGRGDHRRGTRSAFGAARRTSGVADLRGFAAETHDFESRYLDGLVGPLPGSRRSTASGPRSGT